MRELWLTDRLRPLMALLAVVGIAGAVLDAYAQQQQQDPAPKRTQQNKPAAKPAQKPGAAATTDKPGKKPTIAQRTEGLPPSQIGIGTLAQFAFMVDPQSSTVLLFRDADKPMHPSSMAKMMTIYLVFEELASGRIKPDTKFRVSERAWRMQGSKMFVEINSEIAVDDLLKGIIVLSGNDACVVVAEGLAGSEEAFAERMNKKARELGMVGSVFKNASGWPAEGQTTTARDLALVAWHTIQDYPQYYPHYSQTSWTYNNIKQDNRNRLLRITPGTDGLKTGHTEEGGYGQTVSAVRDGRRLILVVNGLTSMEERAQETARLMEWGFREFTNTTIFKAGDTVADAPVWLGEKDTVPLVVTRSIQVTSPTSTPAQPRVVARYEGPLPAPITKGTKLGVAAVTLPDGRTIEYPLEAGADVPRQGVVGRVFTLARHYLFGWLS